MLDLYYQEHNPDKSAEPVVLLHGLFGSLTNWGTVIQQLDDYWVVAPDLRNHGRSPHADDVSYAAMAEDVIGLLDTLDAARACLVGHSMGGKLAMQLALRYPQRIRSLAVVDMAPVKYTHNFATIFAAFNRIDLTKINSRAEAREQMHAAALDEKIKAFLLQNLRRDKDRWYWRINLPALQVHYPEITGYPDPGEANYPGKAWFIYGGQSSYVLPKYHPAIFCAFPHAKFCPVAQAGHWVYADQPDRFMCCLRGFLAAC